MNVCEAHRSRHLVIRLDRGDELPSALTRALAEVEARAGFITGVGAFEAVELAHYDQARRTYERARRVDAPCEVLALTGNIAVLDGSPSVRLSAMLSRETDVGLSTLAGQVVWARVFELELHVTVLDDVALTRVADERTGLPIVDAKRIGSPLRLAAEPAQAVPASAPASPPAASPTHATPAVAAAPSGNGAPLQKSALPPRAQVEEPESEEQELEPDAGDIVLHFHFGECTVVSSNGDKIRLRQERPGSPVLDVALTKLRIELLEPSADGKRRFKLHRKN
jgi:predicted DNA-binding protein with PD1-like motif